MNTEIVFNPFSGKNSLDMLVVELLRYRIKMLEFPESMRWIVYRIGPDDSLNYSLNIWVCLDNDSNGRLSEIQQEVTNQLIEWINNVSRFSIKIHFAANSSLRNFIDEAMIKILNNDSNGRLSEIQQKATELIENINDVHGFLIKIHFAANSGLRKFIDDVLMKILAACYKLINDIGAVNEEQFSSLTRHEALLLISTNAPSEEHKAILQRLFNISDSEVKRMFLNRDLR